MAESELVRFCNALSTVLGWISFACWSASFYPQPYLNLQRRSIEGWNIDYPFLNVLGFAAYTASTGASLWSRTIRAQYAYRKPAAPVSTVRVNDFAFALHALVASVVTYSQVACASVWGIKVGENQKVTRPGWSVFGVCVAGIAASMVAVLALGTDVGYDPSGWAWIDVINSIAWAKMIVTFYKYMPQVYDNYRRKATTGFSIWQILLDAFGGVTSVGQQIIDSSRLADWSGMTGNPVKFGLSMVTLAFDLILMVQHYGLYPDGDARMERRAEEGQLEVPARDEGEGQTPPRDGGEAQVARDASLAPSREPQQRQRLQPRVPHRAASESTPLLDAR